MSGFTCVCVGAGNWHVGQNFMYTGEDRATPNGTVFGEITFPDSDPQSRESYVGELYRQKPHGNGILRWRRGNYVRFDGAVALLPFVLPTVS